MLAVIGSFVSYSRNIPDVKVVLVVEERTLLLLLESAGEED